MASEDKTVTVRIPRPARVETDARGRTVFTGAVDDDEVEELELISTGLLQNIVDSDAEAREEIRRVAREQPEGLLARNSRTGHFEMLSRETVEKHLERPPRPQDTEPKNAAGRGADDEAASIDFDPDALEIVTTSHLKRLVLETPDGEELDPGEDAGFDPYNTAK